MAFLRLSLNSCRFFSNFSKFSLFCILFKSKSSGNFSFIAFNISSVNSNENRWSLIDSSLGLNSLAAKSSGQSISKEFSLKYIAFDKYFIIASKFIEMVSLHSSPSHDAFTFKVIFVSPSESFRFCFEFVEKLILASTLSFFVEKLLEISKFCSYISALFIILLISEFVILSIVSSKVMLGLPHAVRHNVIIDTIPRINFLFFILF